MRTLWGVEGGGLERHVWQTHGAIGRRWFYFTFASRLPFRRYVRLRIGATLHNGRPVQIKYGRLQTYEEWLTSISSAA